MATCFNVPLVYYFLGRARVYGNCSPCFAPSAPWSSRPPALSCPVTLRNTWDVAFNQLSHFPARVQGRTAGGFRCADLPARVRTGWRRAHREVSGAQDVLASPGRGATLGRDVIGAKTSSPPEETSSAARCHRRHDVIGARGEASSAARRHWRRDVIGARGMTSSAARRHRRQDVIGGRALLAQCAGGEAWRGTATSTVAALHTFLQGLIGFPFICALAIALHFHIAFMCPW